MHGCSMIDYMHGQVKIRGILLSNLCNIKSEFYFLPHSYASLTHITIFGDNSIEIPHLENFEQAILPPFYHFTGYEHSVNMENAQTRVGTRQSRCQ